MSAHVNTLRNVVIVKLFRKVSYFTLSYFSFPVFYCYYHPPSIWSLSTVQSFQFHCGPRVCWFENASSDLQRHRRHTVLRQSPSSDREPGRQSMWTMQPLMDAGSQVAFRVLGLGSSTIPTLPCGRWCHTRLCLWMAMCSSPLISNRWWETSKWWSFTTTSSQNKVKGKQKKHQAIGFKKTQLCVLNYCRLGRVGIFEPCCAFPPRSKLSFFFKAQAQHVIARAPLSDVSSVFVSP